MRIARSGGDQTAVSLWQAQLSVPVQVRPQDRAKRAMVDAGERYFRDIGCAGAIIVRAWYEGRIDLAEAIRLAGATV